MNRPIAVVTLIGLAALSNACSESQHASAEPAVAVAAVVPEATPASTSPTAASQTAANPSAAAVVPPEPPPPELALEPPPRRDPEELLRIEVASWRKTPYRDAGTTRSGIGNPGFVRAVFRGVFDTDIPATLDQQIRTGKLVERKDLAPGDLIFFESGGFGPFRSRSVGILIARDQFAIANKDLGVSVLRLSQSKWSDAFKTARRISSERATGAPTFDAASYGSNRVALMRDIAKAWTGTLYLQGGTTFDGIGNDEFVRSIYEAIYDTELEGTPKTWTTTGLAVKRTALEPGDVILYEAVGLGKFVNQRHAGMYIGDGEFVHAVKGGAVTISKLKDPRWSKAYKAARRFDPDVLERLQEKREAARLAAESPRGPTPGSSPTPGTADVPRDGLGQTARSAESRPLTEPEARLREAVEPWRGTPYKLGGTSKDGVDCSALVRAVYEEVYDIKLPRTAEEQERLGAKVDRRSLQTGDLIFFRTQGMGPFFKSRHVGVYLGNGEFAQASGRLGVNIARLDNYYWNKKYEGARRLPRS